MSEKEQIMQEMLENIQDSDKYPYPYTLMESFGNHIIPDRPLFMTFLRTIPLEKLRDFVFRSTGLSEDEFLEILGERTYDSSHDKAISFMAEVFLITDPNKPGQRLKDRLINPIPINDALDTFTFDCLNSYPDDDKVTQGVNAHLRYKRIWRDPYVKVTDFSHFPFREQMLRRFDENPAERDEIMRLVDPFDDSQDRPFYDDFLIVALGLITREELEVLLNALDRETIIEYVLTSKYMDEKPCDRLQLVLSVFPAVEVLAFLQNNPHLNHWDLYTDLLHQGA